jgi:hypothetical protein
MCSLRLLSHAVPKVTDKLFARKYIALGRIVTHWPDIIGADMATRTQPMKIHYRKAKTDKDGKKEKARATLEIGASSADCAVLQMQKGLILERINQVFGDAWVEDIKFAHIAPPAKSVAKSRKKAPLNEEDQKYLAEILEEVTDPDIKQRLSSLGKAFLKDKTK